MAVTLTGPWMRLCFWVEAIEKPDPDPTCRARLREALDDFIDAVSRYDFVSHQEAARRVENDYLERRARRHLERKL